MNTRIVPPLAALLVALTPCPSHATESTGQDGPPVLVWGVTATEDVPRESVDMLSFTLVDEFDAVTGMATTDDQLVDAGIATVADSDEWSEDPLLFLAAVARQTRSAEAVTGELNDVGGALVLTLQRIDSGTGLVVRQVTGQTRDDVQILVDSIPEMIARLYDIEYQTDGTVAESGSRNGYSYVVATFGNPLNGSSRSPGLAGCRYGATEKPDTISPARNFGDRPVPAKVSMPGRDRPGPNDGCSAQARHAGQAGSTARTSCRPTGTKHASAQARHRRTGRIHGANVLSYDRNETCPRPGTSCRTGRIHARTSVVRPNETCPRPGTSCRTGRIRGAGVCCATGTKHAPAQARHAGQAGSAARTSCCTTERNMPPPRHVMPDRPGPRQYPSGACSPATGRNGRPRRPRENVQSLPGRPVGGRLRSQIDGPDTSSVQFSRQGGLAACEPIESVPCRIGGDRPPAGHKTGRES